MLKTTSFKIQVTCPGCNSNHTVTGITESETCQNCGKYISLKDFFTQDMFNKMLDRRQFLNGFLSGTIQQLGGGGVGQAGSFKMTYSALSPYCEECNYPVDEGNIHNALNNKTYITCSKCNHVMPMRAADHILSEFHPEIIGVVNDAYGVDYDEKNVNKDSMIVFSCMTCGAGLKLNNKTQRTIKCLYCDNENYLPDNIWQKIHPNEEVAPFFVIMDLEEKDIIAAMNYFSAGQMLRIYQKHFDNFITEIFQNFHLSDSLKVWLKLLLNSKTGNKDGHGISFTELQKHFYNEFSLGLNNHNPGVKQFIAEYADTIPVNLQEQLAKDKDEAVRTALARNQSLDKNIIKLLQHDSSPVVAAQAKKLKTGLFGGLFG